MNVSEMNYKSLVDNMQNTHKVLNVTVNSAINKMMTIRNWLLGYYIVEYEQNGNDRAEYGSRLLERLEEDCSNIKGFNATLFRYCRRFYQLYPQIASFITDKTNALPELPIQTTALPKLQSMETETIQTTVLSKFVMPAEMIVNNLSFSHIREIMRVDDEMERYFYELECIKCGWSVRELDRQISSKLFFRTGISQDPEKLLQETVSTDKHENLMIRDPFVFEFLGLDAKVTVSESDLEQAIMDHLQDFLLELGYGFCFEARQKRIVIDDEYYFIDLVLYNRLLHCNVIIELKADKFRHEHFGQLNSYVSYYKDCEMTEGDNPPVGILLCTEKGEKMVEYALNGIDEQVFVSTYMLHLPDKKQLEDFLAREIKDMGV